MEEKRRLLTTETKRLWMGQQSQWRFAVIRTGHAEGLREMCAHESEQQSQFPLDYE
jgi:hypothetical protein